MPWCPVFKCRNPSGDIQGLETVRGNSGTVSLYVEQTSMRVGLCCKQEAVKNLSCQKIGLCFSIVSQNKSVLYCPLLHGVLKCVPPTTEVTSA